MVPPYIILGHRIKRQTPKPEAIYGSTAYMNGDRDPITGKTLEIDRDGFERWVDEDPTNYSPDQGVCGGNFYLGVFEAIRIWVSLRRLANNIKKID